MSVPAGKRNEQKLTVLTKARGLCDYTLTICSNENQFPKRQRWTLTNRIVDASLNLMECIRKANTIQVVRECDFLRRREYQQKAMEHAEWMLTLIDLAKTHFSLESKRVEYWTGLVLELETILSAWRSSDRNAWEKKQKQKTE